MHLYFIPPSISSLETNLWLEFRADLAYPILNPNSQVPKRFDLDMILNQIYLLEKRRAIFLEFFVRKN